MHAHFAVGDGASKIRASAAQLIGIALQQSLPFGRPRCARCLIGFADESAPGYRLNSRTVQLNELSKVTQDRCPKFFRAPYLC